MTSSADARHKLRSSLLPATLEHAATSSPLYAGRWLGRANVRTIEQLPSLPIVTKEDIVRSQSEATPHAGTAALVQRTTGTTGTPLNIYRGSEELQFLREFFANVARSETTGIPAVVLHLADLYHGPSLDIPSNAHPVRAGITDDILLKEAVRLLLAEHATPAGSQRVSTIVGLVPYIKTLTNYLLETDFDFTQTRVKVICPLCTIVTPRWRELLMRVWGAHVVDRYSLAEVFGGATRCLKCGAFHFDPVVIPEVVHPGTHEPISSGMGALVLTSLYPFVQMQPMIRYWTGDLVEISTDSCQPDLSVIFKGRITSTPFVTIGGEKRIVIAPVDLYEMLDELPDVDFSDRFIDVRSIRDHTAAGAIRFSMKVVDGYKPTFSIEVSLRYSPHLYAERCTNLKALIAQKLKDKSELLAAGTIDLSLAFTGPNLLPPYSLKI